MPQKTIYVAGPMRGYPLYNFPAFDAASTQLRTDGWAVISPAEIDREVHGSDVDQILPEEVDMAFLRATAVRDVNAITKCDAIYMLDGWGKSKGANAEKAIAEWIGLEVVYQPKPIGEIPVSPIVAFCGKAGSGKDTAANTFVEKERWAKFSFAEPIKSMLGVYLGYHISDAYVIERMLNGDLKESPSEFLGGKSPRQALQTLGTEWGRNLIDQDIWVNTMRSRLKKARSNSRPVAIADMRFPNERELVKEFNGLAIRVVRAGVAPVAKHSSETQNFYVNAMILNDGSIDDLYDNVKRLIN